MKPTKVAVSLILIAVLLDSSLLFSLPFPHGHSSPASAQQSSAAPSLALSATAAGAWNFADGSYLSANMTTRGEIMAFILSNPGVYLREIGEDLGLAIGVVQYHTWVLSREGEIEEYRGRRYRRFFGAAQYCEAERKVISVLRQGTAGKILVLLSDGPPLAHAKLAGLLGVSSQALTWHMKRLESMGLVENVAIQGGPRLSYRLADGTARIIQATRLPRPGLVPAASAR